MKDEEKIKKIEKMRTKLAQIRMDLVGVMEDETYDVLERGWAVINNIETAAYLLMQLKHIFEMRRLGDEK